MPEPPSTASQPETGAPAPAAPPAAADAGVASLPPEAIELATKLFDFARAGATADLKAYIDAGIPANLTNQSGDTLLMLAAYHGHADTVRMLLAAGADANALNAKGQAPIAGAVFKMHDDVVRTLFDAGADVSAGHPNAVDCAAMFKRPDLTELFASRK